MTSISVSSVSGNAYVVTSSACGRGAPRAYHAAIISIDAGEVALAGLDDVAGAVGHEQLELVALDLTHHRPREHRRRDEIAAVGRVGERVVTVGARQLDERGVHEVEAHAARPQLGGERLEVAPTAPPWPPSTRVSPGDDICAAIDDTTTTRPAPRSTIAGTTARVSRTGER